ncbi:MAG TPA: enoyl-CoA hydratase-related protein [Actinomycetota bacterium]|nr:enoyl-CoA hydratase-related protein [Actinomycetota bacterium]
MSSVLLDDSDGVAVLTLNRPDAKNAIDLDLATALDEATQRMQDARCVLLTAKGPAFCAGGDLKAFSSQDDMSGYVSRVVTHVHAALRRIDSLDVPVVAAVRGAAAGAGLGLACSADIVLASATARFVSAFTKIGVTPDGSSTWVLPRLVGMRRALELVLTNRVLSADEAADWGIATRVVPDDDLEDEAMRVAHDLADGPTAALGRAKRLLRTSLDDTLDTQLDKEKASLVLSASEADAAEGIDAFLGKREPKYH